VKSIAQGSAADLSHKIAVNDQIIEVDGISLVGYTNHQAVDVLRSTGRVVKLRLARYLCGTKYEQLQQAIASTDFQTLKRKGSKQDSASPYEAIEKRVEVIDIHATEEGITPPPYFDNVPVESFDLESHWQRQMGPNYSIVIAQIQKFKESGGLGISLEGTVDIENGKEVRPHHYIRAVLPDGPVGLNGLLQSGDEILQVNGKELIQMNHVEVVSLLKDLPVSVEMICARKTDGYVELSAKDADRQETMLSSVTSSESIPSTGDRLVKAKSDGSLAIGSSSSDVTKIRSRSLEPLTGLAMWNSEPHIIELIKGERGLGFSILDYQVR